MRTQPASKPFRHYSRILTITTATALFTFLLIGVALMQQKSPYDKERLLRVVKLNALSTQEIVAASDNRGVDFKMTPNIEAEFQQAGARPELLDAMRRNYRSATTTSTPDPNTTVKNNTNTTVPPKSNGKVPPGPP